MKIFEESTVKRVGRRGMLLRMAALVATVAVCGSVSATPIAPDSLSTDGLHNSRTLDALFRGDFVEVEFKREDMEFSVVLQGYLNAYARRCADHLPANKIEMTEQQCQTERVTRNGFGTEISRVCVEYVDVGTGLFAKPELYEALQEINRLMAADRLRQSWRLLATIAEPDSLAGIGNMVATGAEINGDMQALIRRNACSGPGLHRFEQNLRLFALNKEGIRLDGSSGSPPATARVWSSFSSDDYQHMIDELIADQSRTWAVNRYVRGSVGRVNLSMQDHLPSSVKAPYSYDGFNGRSRGSVELTFAGGSPRCLVFFDAPGICRTPDRAIIAQHIERVESRPATERATGLDRASESATGTTFRQSANLHSAERSAAGAGERVPEGGRQSDLLVSSGQLEDPPAPQAPRRVLKAVNYVQGIKDACLEVLADGERVEPETTYCFCLSGAVGTISVPTGDVRWYFENFSEAASVEMERRHPALVRPFAFCRAQRDAYAPD